MDRQIINAYRYAKKLGKALHFGRIPPGLLAEERGKDIFIKRWNSGPYKFVRVVPPELGGQSIFISLRGHPLVTSLHCNYFPPESSRKVGVSIWSNAPSSAEHFAMTVDESRLQGVLKSHGFKLIEGKKKFDQRNYQLTRGSDSIGSLKFSIYDELSALDTHPPNVFELHVDEDHFEAVVRALFGTHDDLLHRAGEFNTLNP